MTKAMLFAVLACASTGAIAQAGGLSGGVVGSAGATGAMSSFGAPGTFGADARSIGGDSPASERNNGVLAPATARPAPADPAAVREGSVPVPSARPPVSGNSWGTPANVPPERSRQ
ncbi:MAG: hypothetical protein ABR570_17685 [Burkholderiales bacterium]